MPTHEDLTPSPAAIEIVEPVQKSIGGIEVHSGVGEIVIPSRLLINGVPVLVPGDPEIEIGGINDRGPLTVRLTMYVSSIRMGSMDVDG